MIINVPSFSENGFKFIWEDGFSIKCTINGTAVLIEANKEGLISLARHFLELADDCTPELTHFHLDEFNSLNDNSAEIIVVKKNM